MTRMPKRAGTLLDEVEPGHWAIEDTDSGLVHKMNESAKAIWDLCDGATTVNEMAAAISDVTGITLEKAKGDVEMTVARLAELSLVSS